MSPSARVCSTGTHLTVVLHVLLEQLQLLPLAAERLLLPLQLGAGVAEQVNLLLGDLLLLGRSAGTRLSAAPAGPATASQPTAHQHSAPSVLAATVHAPPTRLLSQQWCHGVLSRKRLGCSFELHHTALVLVVQFTNKTAEKGWCPVQHITPARDASTPGGH